MKTISQIFEAAIKKNEEKGYKNLYVAIDVHGTIFKPTKQTHLINADCGNKPHEVVCSYGITPEFQFYWFAKECLVELSTMPNVRLILWTSAIYQNEIVKKLESFGIKIYAVNHNPDFAHNCSTQEIYADFTTKFYFDILLDDKSGFDPQKDWEELYGFLEKKSREKYELDLEEYRRDYMDSHWEYFHASEEDEIENAREYEMKLQEYDERMNQ